MKKEGFFLKSIFVLWLGLLVSCKKESISTLETLPIANITNTSALTGGNIISDGGTPVSKRGIVWSTTPNPTIANNSTNDGFGIGKYISELTGLTANTKYYIRAYATNQAGTAYGELISFKTSGTMIDQDGNTYSTVLIGTQVWMAENLRTSIYRNGDSIPNVTDNSQWKTLTSGASSFYNNESQYSNPYGKLYNWYAVADPRMICPNGWHVPTLDEWSILIDYLGGETVAGGKMKSKSRQYWQNPNKGATNVSGFSGLPGGGRSVNGSFGDLGTHGHWWSFAEDGAPYAWFRGLIYNTANVYKFGTSKKNGLCVRCLRD